MANYNFYDYAKPWLDQLKDDPDRSPLTIDNTTNFPASNFEWNVNGLTLLKNNDESDTPLPNSTANEADVDAARSARSFAGLDVLAFYKSFRFIDRQPFPGHWGIFLLDAGIEGLARDLITITPTLSRSDAVQFARKILLTHEQYHFWIDTWGLGQEIISLKSNLVKQYEYYLSGKHKDELTQYDWEESLANYYVFKKLRNYKTTNGHSVSGALRNILLDAPSPYSDCFLDAAERAKREGLLAISVANGKSPSIALCDLIPFKLQDPNLDLSVLSASIQPSDKRHFVVGTHHCPIYHVQTSGYASYISPFQGPKLTEFKQFIENYLAGEKDKFTDHQYYKIDNKERIKFPNPHDKEVRRNELKGTLHAAGMTQQEFNNARSATNYWKNNCPRSPVKQPFSK